MRIFYYLTAAIIICSLFSFEAEAVNTARIDVVRAKETLTDADTAVVDEFLTAAFEEFFAKTSFSDIATLRTTIISKSVSEQEPGQIQYGPRFLTAAQNQIKATFEKINALNDDERKQLLTMNMLVLINDLGNIEIARTAIDYTQNQDLVVRYWAVNCITNNIIVKQLNTTGSDQTTLVAEQFIKKLQTVVKTENNGDVLVLIAQFSANLKYPAANELLVQIAQKRQEQYLKWQIDNEMIESGILKALSDRMQNDAANIKITAKEFATLYSLVIQRYALGTEILSETSKQSLVSVIAGGEKYITRAIPDWTGTFKRAIEKGSGASLLIEQESMFGSATVTGKLPMALGFDYGKKADGSTSNAPPQMPKPPAKAVVKTEDVNDANTTAVVKKVLPKDANSQAPNK